MAAAVRGLGEYQFKPMRDDLSSPWRRRKGGGGVRKESGPMKVNDDLTVGGPSGVDNFRPAREARRKRDLGEPRMRKCYIKKRASVGSCSYIQIDRCLRTVDDEPISSSPTLL
jgi:hypothetical protein